MKDSRWYSQLYQDQFQETWQQLQQQDAWLKFADFVRIELALYAIETKFPGISAKDFGYLLQGIPVNSLQSKKKLISRLRGYLRHIRSQPLWQDFLDKYLNAPAFYRVRGYDLDQQGRPIHRGVSCAPDRFNVYGNFLQNPAPLKIRSEYRPAPAGNYIIIDSNSKPRSVQIGEQLAECGLRSLPNIDLTLRQRISARAIAIPFDDLISIAEELDQKIPGNWVHRVQDALNGLHKVTKSGLRKVNELRLNGKEHLLGPCAAGKSTIFAVAAIWLERHDYTCAIVYRDVRSLLNQADLFHQVGCSPGVVIGRLKRDEHYTRLLIDGVDFNHYAYTQFHQACPLSVFLSTPLQINEEPPCIKQLQKADEPERVYDCPLLPVCPRHQGTRDLGKAAIILTTPPGMIYAGPTAVIQPEQTVWLETIHKTCDVVFVDEGDGVQAQMDCSFAPAQVFETNRSKADTFCRQLFQSLANGSHEGRIGTPNPDRSDVTFAFSLYSRLFKNGTDLMNLLLEADKKKYTSLSKWVESSHFFAGWQIFGLLADILSGQESGDSQRDELFKAFIAFRSRPTQPDTNLLNDTQKIIVQGLVDILLTTEDVSLTKPKIRNWLTSQQWPIEISAMSMSVEDLIPLVELGIHTSITLGRLDLLIDSWGLMEPYMQTDSTPPGVLNPKPEEYDNILPLTPYGASVALQWYKGNALERDLRYLKVESCGRWILTHWDELYLGDDSSPPHLVVASATSWSPPSYAYDVQIPPTMVINPAPAVNKAIASSAFFFAPLQTRNGKLISVSGSWDAARYQRLEDMVEALTRRDAMGECELSHERKLLQSRDAERDKILLVTGSYAETRWVADCLSRALGNDAVAWLVPDGSGVDVQQFQVEPGGERVARGQVSTFAKLKAWILVAPLMALERGHNIVLDDGRAAIGCVQMLIRPHPRPDALEPYVHLLNRWFIETYPKIRHGDPVKEIQELRSRAGTLWTHLMAYPLYYRQLPEKFDKENLPLRSSFAWSLIVPLIQLIGRTTRGGVATRVFFRDAAFAEATAAGNSSKETASTSILVACEQELAALCTHTDKGKKALAIALFQPLWTAFKNRQVIL